jgi:thiol-disulfide isomerase/thioredoxin
VIRFVALLVAGTALAACGSGDAATDATLAPGTGNELPEVELTALDGSATVRLSEIEGPAVINLWATWCAPCRKEIPDFEAVHRARGDEVRFVGINVGEDADRAAAFLDDVGATYDQFLDSDGYVVTELETTAMPVTIVLDADGRVATRHLGPMDQSDLGDAIDEAIARTADAASTG